MRDDVLLLDDNRYRTVFEVSSVNFELKSEEEQDALIDTYESFLNSLPCPLQIIVRIRELDMSKYVDDLQTRLSDEEEDIYRQQIQNYSEFVQGLVKDNSILSRHFYVVLSFSAKNVDLETAKERLGINGDMISKGFTRLGVRTRQLDNLEILDLFHSFYNPKQAKRQPITDQVVQMLNNSYSRRREIMIDPLTKALAWKKERDERPKELSLAFGDQDHMDALSYEGLEEQADHLVIDGHYVRTLFISGYPFIAQSGWLDNLVHFNHSADISYHIHEVDAQQALPKLNRKITEMESTRRAMMRKGAVIGSEITDPLDSAMELRDKIQRGQEKLFQVSLYVSLREDSLETLDKTTSMLENTLASRLFTVKTARYQQLEALQSILPRGEDQLSQMRNLDSSSAALAFPFMSSEFVHESGILYGVNNSNNSLVILDRFSLRNANSIVFAQSGSGKSYASKVEILRQLMQGTKVIVIDPEREYKNLAESVNGTYIKLSAKSDEKINPFDLATSRHTKDDLSEHTQDLTEIVSLMAEGLSSREKAAVDKAILQVYAAAKKNHPYSKTCILHSKILGSISYVSDLKSTSVAHSPMYSTPRPTSNSTTA